MQTTQYLPFYNDSWALIIGINDYEHVSPLSFACNDADKIAELLIDELGFDESNVLRLKNGDASRKNIFDTYLSLIEKANDPNDRVLVFFAGHGITVDTMGGQVGYLVPCDGNPKDYSTIIRWDDFTRNADLIPAKHILFVMDACYSGLALQRGAPPGTQRFLDDMLQRPVRQVITAGKADEQVADSGGASGTNSIFTGYLIEGLQGAASDENGVVTAYELMAYVYKKVSQDDRSKQTPHYGPLFGEGDFILRTPEDIDLSQPPQSDFILEPQSVDATQPVNVPTERDSFSIRNGYIDPKHPNFGRNDWSTRLAELRGGRSQGTKISKAYSWLSIVVEPTTSRQPTIDISSLAEGQPAHQPAGIEPFEQFRIPRTLITTVDSVILYDEISGRPDLWDRYLRIDHHGNIEYANADVFLEWEGARKFRYVQLIGEIWQFIHYSKRLLIENDYHEHVKLSVNLIGTQDTVLTDFARGKGENDKRWKKSNELAFIGRSQSLKCRDKNISLEYVITLDTFDEEKLKEVIKNIAEKLGLAYNHQSAPRCFNYNTDTYPWNQFRR